jgi:cysteine desulfurase
VDEFGVIDLRDAEVAVRPETNLVSVMLANNETGTLQPVGEIAEIAHERGVLVHTDAVQAIGKIPVDVDELGVDLLSISAHKIYGPKGVGALYIRKGTRIAPLFQGGHHEHEMRPGTENVASIVGFAKALELAVEELPGEAGRLTVLRDRLESGIREGIADARVNGHPEKRLPNIVNLGFEFVEGESILLALDLCGIAVSTGSACTSGSPESSHVLLAMRVPPEVARGSVRFSLGRNNTEEQMDFVAERVTEVVQRLRGMSPMQSRRAL